MPDVKYHTTGFTELGAFMVALSRQSPDTYPKTVEDFMQMLAAYVNHFFYGAATNEIDKSKPSPDIPPGLASKGPGQAKFIPHAGDEKDAIGSWVLDGILEVQNVQRNAQRRASRAPGQVPQAQALIGQAPLAQGFAGLHGQGHQRWVHVREPPFATTGF